MKYFKELDDNNIDKPYFIERYNNGITITSQIPYEFFIKHKSVFTHISDLNKMFEFLLGARNYAKCFHMDFHI